ncbi:MAG: YraN family protein [Oscillospiraceae bacterium]|nr:YraN family protein [Oscillospiraceae bacterium]
MAKSDLLGAWGEVAAAEYLRKKRYRLLGKNFRLRGGEIDLIAEKGAYLVFVEVKTRHDDGFAQAREYVNAAKQERIRRAAALWLAENETDKQPRFDVIDVYAPEGTATKKPLIRHWEDVF